MVQFNGIFIEDNLINENKNKPTALKVAQRHHWHQRVDGEQGYYCRPALDKFRKEDTDFDGFAEATAEDSDVY